MALKNQENIKFVNACKAIGIEPMNVSRNNKKLVPNKTTAFIIWNIPSVKTCPFATEHCKANCYAKKAEQAYPNCLPSREKNLIESFDDDFVIRMAYTILNIRKGTNKQNVIVRIHESGDFYNQTYTDKWMRIIERCKDEDIIFIAYTKSFKYFDGKKLGANFSLRASVWDDTKQSQLDIIKRNNWNIYTAIEQFTDADKFEHCDCSDCANCGKCWNISFKDIRCEIH